MNDFDVQRIKLNISPLPFKFLLLIVTIISALWVMIAESKEPSVKAHRLTFALPDLNGDVVRSSDARFEGKVLLVTAWGTWCPPCLSEIPTFVDLQERLKGDGLVIVAIAFERDTLVAGRRLHLREFSHEHKINYVVLDGGTTSDFSAALPMVEDVKGLPIEIIIGRSGDVVKIRNGYGYNKRWARKLEKELRKLLKE